MEGMLLDQFKDKHYTEEDFERAITAAMTEMNLSRKDAMCELMLYMTMNGSIEDFKNYFNYFIKNQDKVNK